MPAPSQTLSRVGRRLKIDGWRSLFTVLVERTSTAQCFEDRHYAVKVLMH